MTNCQFKTIKILLTVIGVVGFNIFLGYLFFIFIFAQNGVCIEKHIEINGTTYFIRGCIKGIGGHETVTIGKKMIWGSALSKSDILYSSSNISSVYFEVIHDTVVFYYSDRSSDFFSVPSSVTDVKFRFQRINDISGFNNAECIIDYDELTGKN